jgi:muramoyltetrapeptide carboxypeptidase
MKFALPEPLRSQDRVAVIAPSGAVYDWEKVEAGLSVWRNQGYNLWIPENLSPNWGYLAGDDRHRCQQLITAWNDPDVKAIVCARGGYGAMRLLEQLDWGQIADQPKWLIGFSDITALLWAIAARNKVITLHAPVLTTLGDEPAWSVEHLFQMLQSPDYSWKLQGKGWGGGRVTGRLWVGNLCVASAMIGTNLMPDLTDSILAIEDIYETPYRLDRMLTQWRLSGLLASVKGIALGRFSHADTDLPTLTLEQMFSDRLSDLGIPIVSDLPFGHDGVNLALPVGQIVTLDGDHGWLYSSSSTSEELGFASTKDDTGALG